MNKEYGGIKAWWMIAVLGVAAIGVIFGSIFDWQISSNFAYQYDGFGMFFENFGEALGYAMAPIGGTLIFMGLKSDRPLWMKIVGWATLILSIGVTTYVLGKAGTSRWGIVLPIYVSYPIAFFLMSVASMATFFFAGIKDKNFLVRTGLVILISIVAELLVMYVLKQIGSRPRYRCLYDADASSTFAFHNWWDFQINLSNFQKADDLHRSWPSGHAATASVAMLLPLLVKTKGVRLFKHEEAVWFSLGVVYTIIVCIARIRVGAHYLSDVSCGVIVGSGISFLTAYFGFRGVEKPEMPKIN